MHRNRPVLLIAAVAAFIAGYLLGGSRTPSPTSRENAGAALAARRAEIEERVRSIGKPQVAEGQFSEQRKDAWTPERLADALNRSGSMSNLVRAVRHTLLVADQLGPTDFPMALEVAKSVDDSMMKDVVEMFFLHRWAQVAPQGAAEWMKSSDKLKNNFIPIERNVVFGEWGATDSTAALAWARTLTDKDARESVLGDIIAGAASRDLAAGIALAQAQAPELLADGKLAGSLSELSMRSPEEKARFLASLPMSTNGESEIRDATLEWAKKNPAAAQQWADAQADPKLRSIARVGVLGARVEKEPSAVAVALLTEPREGADFSSIVNGIVGAWPLDDWRGAGAWAVKLPSETERTAALGQLSNNLANSRPADGAKLLESLTPGPARDEAVARYTVQTVEKDGDAAMDWAFTIADRKKRLETMRSLTSDWFRREPAAALEWLNNSPKLNAEDKREMLAK